MTSQPVYVDSISPLPYKDMYTTDWYLVSLQCLPQNHIFNPLLPTTPSFPRQARRHESLLSLKGSPIAVPGSPSHSPCPSDESDLPDPEALEREILAKSTTEAISKPSRKTKRAPSLMFLQSLAPPSLAGKVDDAVLATIPLSDGRTLSFNPLSLSPGRMDGEMEEGGLSETEKERVKAKVREEVVKTLTEQMERWKVI